MLLLLGIVTAIIVQIYYYTKRVKCIFEYYFNSLLKKEGEEMALYDPFILNKNKNREAAMLRYMSATIDIKLFSHNMSGRVAVSYLIFLYSEISFLFSFYFISFFFRFNRQNTKVQTILCAVRTERFHEWGEFIFTLHFIKIH